MANSSADQEKQPQRPAQSQPPPGDEAKLRPQPRSSRPGYVGSGKLRDRVALITGGDSGIGRATAILFAREGAEVAIVYLSEDADAEETARRVEQEGRSCLRIRGDVGRDEFCRAAVQQVIDRFGRLDVLVNNAGGVISDRRVTEDGFEMTFAGNHLGHFLLTELLRDRLVQSAPARVITVSSVVHRLVGSMTWTDLQHETLYNGTLAYNESKLANALFAMELARRLDGTGVVSNCLHPGAVRSGWGSGGDTRGLERLSILFAQPFMVSSHRGAQPIVRLASLPEFETATGGYYVGGYLGRCSKHTPSSAALDPVAGRRLWEISEELVAGTSPGP